MIVLYKDIPLEEMLPHLERDHARVLVALLIYGALTALEEGRITVDTGYRAVLSWSVYLYFKDKVKPRDRILEETLSHSIELGTISRYFGPEAVPPTCREIKAELAPWWTKHMEKGPHARSKKITLSADIALDEMLAPATEAHARVFVTLLVYGTLAALEDELIPLDVGKRVALNRRVLLFIRDGLQPRDRILEEAVSRGIELDSLRQDVPRACGEVTAEIMRVWGTRIWDSYE